MFDAAAKLVHEMTLHDQDEWHTEYPGPSATLAALRESVARAEAIMIESRTAFDHLHQQLQATEIPVHEWHEKLYRRYQAMKRSQHTDSRHFTAALRALRAAFAAEKLAEAKLPLKPEPKLPYVPPPRTHYQNISVAVQPDGSIKHKVFPDANFFLRPDMLANTIAVVRQFGFEREIIPEAYASIAIHKGVPYGPTDRYSIRYSIQEFERLCRLELATGSEYVLDSAERLGYTAFESIQKLRDEEEQYEKDKEKR